MMRWKWNRVLLAIPLVAAGAAAQARDQCGGGEESCKKSPAESVKPWPLYQKGVRWHDSLDEAREAAAREKKLVFWYQIVGRLDREGC